LNLLKVELKKTAGENRKINIVVVKAISQYASVKNFTPVGKIRKIFKKKRVYITDIIAVRPPNRRNIKKLVKITVHYRYLCS
jgi:hypothetical protein